MRILCTNDDGIHAPGLQIIEQIAKQLSDDVWIVAPELDQSGVSHSLSLNDPLRLREIDLAPLAELHQRYQRVGKIMKVHQQSLISP